MIFGLAHSIHGTSKSRFIADQYPCFKGFEARHIHSKLFTWLHFHSVAALTRDKYDLFAIREYFQDSEQVREEGFRYQKGLQLYHPEMNTALETLWFKRFKLSEHRLE